VDIITRSSYIEISWLFTYLKCSLWLDIIVGGLVKKEKVILN